jgi:serine/threonine-protein kinase
VAASESSERVGRTGPAPAAESPYPDQIAWLRDVTEAQRLVSEGKQPEALELLRGAFQSSRHPMARNLMEQLQVAQLAQSAGAACQVTGFARPRLQDLVDPQSKPGQAGPPAIAWAPDGAIATWTETRDGGQRAMAAALDGALRNRRAPVEITPETSAVRTPQLLPTAERIVAAYADASGPNAGVYLRWLDRDGVIAAAPIVVANGKPVRYAGSAARTADGGVVVTWAEGADPAGVELYLRSYGPDLSPRSEPVHLTAYARKPTLRRAIRSVAAAATPGHVHVAYAYAQDPLTQVRSQSVASNAAAPGVEPGKGPVASATDRTLGTERTLSPKTARAIDPAIACGNGGCFVTWHALQGGGGVAFVDAQTGESRWYRPLGPRSAHPTVSVGSDGEVRLLWAEGGRLLTAKVGPDGIGPSSKIARLVGDRQTASLAPGREPGEWFVAWLDFEAARAEPYGARLRCR